MPHAERLERLVSRLTVEGFDALIVVAKPNIRWLCGFAGSNSIMVVGRASSVLITDSRYEEVATELCEGLDLVLEIRRSGIDQFIGRFCSDNSKVGYEASRITAERLGELDNVLGAKLSPCPRLIEGLRRVKDSAEIERIREAASIADLAFAELRSLISAGRSERSLAARLDYEMALAGSHGVSFETIVASGPNSAKPHSVPGDRVLTDGDLVVFDFGASVDGYGSDMTRTLLIGGRNGGWSEQIYDLVLVAQEAGVAAAQVGATTGDVDYACRSIIDEAGHGGEFIHGTGHSLGLEIHEAPFVSAGGEDELVPGNIITVEPGIYKAGRGGVRIEDCVLIGNEGPTRITLTSKEIVVSDA